MDITVASKSLMEAAYYYGLGIVLAIGGMVMLFFIIKWVLIEKRDERRMFNDIISQMNKSIDKHTEQAAVFHQMVVEAHKYQREEHQRMIDTLQQVSARLKL